MKHSISRFFLILMGAFAIQASESTIRFSYCRDVSVREPSDIGMKPDGSGYFIVSDDGMLFETDSAGKVIRKSDFGAFDLEGLFVDSSGLWVMDERTRYLYKINQQTLQPDFSFHLPYSGGRNSGFEAICRNPVTGRLLAVTEKNPVWVMEFSPEKGILNRKRLHGLSDVSAATIIDGKLFFLSDEDHCVARINPITYDIENRIKILVLNPEGISGACGGGFVVSSDDLGRLYFFNDASKLP